MKHYDPDIAPDPAEWLELDEQIRIKLVERHHRAQRVETPNLKIHACVHTVVENQIAGGLESVVRAMARLESEGLSRHESLHAIGSVVAERIYEAFSGKDTDPASFSEAQYNADVDRMTAKEWRRRYG